MNVLKIGTKLARAVEKSYPISVHGSPIAPPNLKFDITNPYILETLADEKIFQYLRYQGENLKQVCKLLDKTELDKGFNEFELKYLYKKAFPNIRIPSDVNSDAMIYLNGLPESIGSKFDAHGLCKISVADQLKQLNELLAKGIDKTRKIFTAPLAVPKEDAAGLGAALGTGGGCAIRDGSFIVVSGKSKLLVNDGIKHVIVNDAYYNIIDDLRKKFPEVGFVRADKVVEYFSKL